jgi:predicted amidohydrolase YtcJ
MDPDNNITEAVAVKDGRIVAVASNQEIFKQIGKDTKVIDLSGRVMLPGFYAAHDHLPGAGTAALFKVDLNSPPIGKIRNMTELVEALKARARNTPKGQWVVGRGYDDTLLTEKRHPTINDLDKVSTEHPIWIQHTSGHLGVANSLALKRAKITKDTPDPTGGVICKDTKTGEPTGVFEECGSKVSSLIPAFTQDQIDEAIGWCSKHYVSKGVTTTVIAGGNKGKIGHLKRALEKGLLDLRVLSMTSLRDAESSRRLLDDVDPNRLKVSAVKMFQDGSNQGYTGYFSEPYHTPFKGNPNYRGYPCRSREALAMMVEKAHRTGYQIAIHGNGDAAIDDIIYAFEQAQEEYPRVDARHRIEHCQMVREDQLDKIKMLGITPSFFAGHVYYWGDRHRDIFMGPERAARISPLESSVARHIRFTVHDDTPVTPVDPLQLVWVVVNRLTKSRKVLGPQQRISVKEALRAITIDAAWQNFEEELKGSIEVGKLADFVILAENPLAVKAASIKEIAILETIVGGQTVYRR